MINWILSEIEKEPTIEFYQKELEGKDAATFAKLRSEKLLITVPLNEQNETFGFGQTEPLTIVKIHGKLYGVNEQDPEADPVLLSRSGVMRYNFSVERFSSMLRIANNLKESKGPLGKRLFVLGIGDFYRRKITYVLAFLDSDATARNVLMSLRSQLSPDTDLVAVVTPYFNFESEVLRAQFARIGIYRVPIANMETLRIDMSNFYLEPSNYIGSALLDQEEKDASARQGYKVEVPIYIAGTEEKWNTTLVVVNGCKVPLGDGPFILFLRMFVHLREKPEGSLTKAGLVTGGYLKRSRQEQIISDLRKAFDRAIQGRGAELVESSGRGMIRLSIHPHLIKYNVEALKRHRLEKVRRLAERLP